MDKMISILTPSFNSGKYIDRAIQSVLFQSYHNWEHIIVDGGSTDDTMDILNQYDHLKWISEPDNGQSDAMNKAFEMSKGDIIMYLNADDEVAEGAFEIVVKEFKKKPSIKFLAGNILIITSKERIVFHPTRNKYLAIDPRVGHFPVNPVGYYYKREVQHRIGIFPIELHYKMDFWFLMNVYKHFRVHTVNYLLGIFHHHDDNKTHNNISDESAYEIFDSIFSRYEKLIIIFISVVRKIKNKSFLKDILVRKGYSGLKKNDNDV